MNSKLINVQSRFQKGEVQLRLVFDELRLPQEADVTFEVDKNVVTINVVSGKHPLISTAFKLPRNVIQSLHHQNAARIEFSHSKEQQPLCGAIALNRRCLQRTPS